MSCQGGAHKAAILPTMALIASALNMMPSEYGDKDGGKVEECSFLFNSSSFGGLSDADSTSEIFLIPDETWPRLGLFLTLRDLFCSMLVCRKWFVNVNDKVDWKLICEIMWRGKQNHPLERWVVLTDQWSQGLYTYCHQKPPASPQEKKACVLATLDQDIIETKKTILTLNCQLKQIQNIMDEETGEKFSSLMTKYQYVNDKFQFNRTRFSHLMSQRRKLETETQWMKGCGGSQRRSAAPVSRALKIVWIRQESRVLGSHLRLSGAAAGLSSASPSFSAAGGGNGDGGAVDSLKDSYSPSSASLSSSSTDSTSLSPPSTCVFAAAATAAFDLTSALSAALLPPSLPSPSSFYLHMTRTIESACRSSRLAVHSNCPFSNSVVTDASGESQVLGNLNCADFDAEVAGFEENMQKAGYLLTWKESLRASIVDSKRTQITYEV